jgi:hypothetical protein
MTEEFDEIDDDEDEEGPFSLSRIERQVVWIFFFFVVFVFGFHVWS